MIPMDAATAAGVLVANVPGANAATVAEHVIFTAHGAAAPLPHRRPRPARRDGWAAGARACRCAAAILPGRTLGIVGMGNIGQAIFTHRPGGFGLDVIANSRRRESLPDGARFAAIDELVGEGRHRRALLPADAGDAPA